ncbi:MAG: tripartite tricarboxylate transporter TctB family protein [Deltaproteobacteria bacterium]|nr:MAG: tripartite tricarboxylate transporter TctB family protein [Deltaproteobacteria bacterium]
MRIRTADRVIGFTFLLTAIAGFYHTYSFPAHDSYTYGDSIFVTPSFYPKVLLLLLGILSVFLIVRSHLTAPSKDIQWSKKDMLRVLLTYMCFLLYLYLLPRVGELFIIPGMGFIITSGLFSIFLMIGLGSRKYFWIFLSSFAVIGSVYLFFVSLLKIMFP